MSQHPPDALMQMVKVNPSPTLTILREAVENKEEFTLRHEPMQCPPLPELAKRVPAGRRSHCITTLTDLAQYVDHVKETDPAASPIAFYTPAGVSVVLNEASQNEKEVVTCTLERHHRFQAWAERFGEPMSQLGILNLLREHGDCVDGEAEYLINIYSALSGTLVHDAEEYLSRQSQAAAFTVKRKGRSGEVEQEVDDVPTEFTISVPILADDAEETPINVLVRMSGAAGARIVFTLTGHNLAETESAHIENRLKDFAASAGFLCLRGAYREQPWSEPTLPKSVHQLMELQTSMIKAMAPA